MGSEELLLLSSLLLSPCQPGDDRSERLHLGIRHLNVGETVLFSPREELLSICSLLPLST